MMARLSQFEPPTSAERLARWAEECERRAAKPQVDAADAEALLDAAEHYRRKSWEITPGGDGPPGRLHNPARALAMCLIVEAMLAFLLYVVWRNL